MGWGTGRCANVINIIFITQKYADERGRATTTRSETRMANEAEVATERERMGEKCERECVTEQLHSKKINVSRLELWYEYQMIKDLCTKSTDYKR